MPFYVTTKDYEGNDVTVEVSEQIYLLFGVSERRKNENAMSIAATVMTGNCKTTCFMQRIFHCSCQRKKVSYRKSGCLRFELF